MKNGYYLDKKKKENNEYAVRETTTEKGQVRRVVSTNCKIKRVVEKSKIGSHQITEWV